MNFGTRLVNLRKECKISQEEFSEIFNVTRQTVSNWENSKSYPNIETLIKISEYFNISLDILLKEDKIMIKKIANKTKQKNIIIISLLVVIFLCTSIFLLGFLFPEKFDNYDKMPVAMIMYKTTDENGDLRISDYHIYYNKIFKYPDKGYTYGTVTKAERNVSKQLESMPTFKYIDEHINYVKELYENEGMEVLVIYLNNIEEYSQKYLYYYDKLNN